MAGWFEFRYMGPLALDCDPSGARMLHDKYLTMSRFLEFLPIHSRDLHLLRGVNRRRVHRFLQFQIDS